MIFDRIEMQGDSGEYVKGMFQLAGLGVDELMVPFFMGKGNWNGVGDDVEMVIPVSGVKYARVKKEVPDGGGD